MKQMVRSYDNDFSFINFRLIANFTVYKNIFIVTHGITVDRVRRFSYLLLKNQTQEDKRRKNKSGNAIPSDIFVHICEHINRFNVKITIIEKNLNNI